MTTKETDKAGVKRVVIRMRFGKKEKFKKQAKELGIEPEKIGCFEEWLMKFLQSATQELVAGGYRGAPLDWLHFVKYAKKVAKALDEKLVYPDGRQGPVKLEGGSTGNFLFTGHHVTEGALREKGGIGEKKYNASLIELAQNLGLRSSIHFPSTLDRATLYAKLEALELLINGERVQLRTKDVNKQRHVDIDAEGISGSLTEEKAFATAIDGIDAIFGLTEKDKITLTTNGIQAVISEEFQDVVSSRDSKTAVNVLWDSVKQCQIVVQHGNFIIYITNPDKDKVKVKLEKIIREFRKRKPEINKGDKFTLKNGEKGIVFDVSKKEKGWIVSIYVPVPKGKYRIEYGNAIKIKDPEKADERAAEVKVLKDDREKLTAEVSLDTKGQGTTIYFNKTPITFRGRLIIEQTNITESLHTSKIVETGFVDGVEPTANPKVLDLIENTQELITIGPGSIITSLLPVLMVPEIVDALHKRREKDKLPVIFIVNPFKDNESVDATIAHLLNLIEQVINRGRSEGKQLKVENIISHMIVNNAEIVPEELKPLMYELTDEKIDEFISKPRDPGDFAGPAKLSRGPLGITEEEMRTLSGIKIYREPLATKTWREKRVAGKAEKEFAIGYDVKRLGQVIENIVLEQGISRLKNTSVYQEILERYYRNDENLLDADINRLLYEGGWLYTPEVVIRTPLEVLTEIKRKREEIPFSYIGSDEIAENTENPPRIIISNAAHTLLRYRKPSLDDKTSVKKISDSMKDGIETYLENGGILIVFTALSLSELQSSLTNHLDKNLLKQVILVPYAGARAWRFRENGKLDAKPFIDYSDQITPEQLTKWRNICKDAERTYELDRYLYEAGKSEPIDSPVVAHDRDGLLINFEMDFRRNLPDQVVARINEELAKKDVPKLPISILNDERDAVIEYLNERFKDEGLPVGAEKGGTGAINTRLKVVDRPGVAKEIIRTLNKEALENNEIAYEKNQIYVIGKGNNPILEELLGVNGIYFREEPIKNIPENVRIYAGTYGINGVEEFFEYLPSNLTPTASASPLHFRQTFAKVSEEKGRENPGPGGAVAVTPQSVISDVEKLTKDITTHSLLGLEAKVDLSKMAIVMKKNLPEGITGEKGAILGETLKHEYQVMKQRLGKTFPDDRNIVEVATKEELLSEVNNLIDKGLKVIALDDGTLTKDLDKDQVQGKAGIDYCFVIANALEGLDEATIQFVNLNAMVAVGIGILNKDTRLFQLAYEAFTGQNVPPKMLEQLKNKVLWIIKALPRIVRFTGDFQDRREIQKLFSVAA